MKSAYDVPSETPVASGRRAELVRARAEHEVSAWSRWLEVLSLTLLVPLAIACVAPHDPLLRGAAFPWLALLPLLLGAWHGALAGALSAALLVGAGVLHAELAGGSSAGLAAFGGGCGAIGIIAGSFRDRVRAQLAQLERESRDSARELSRLGRSHLVLELSHRRLEERLAARRWSIASAFRDAQRALAGAASLTTVGDVVLGVLSNHAFVQSATLVGATPRSASSSPATSGPAAAVHIAAVHGVRHELRVSASLNGPAQVDLQHRLVQRALDSGRLVALDAESADLDADESIVAVAPLRSVGGRLLGLVLVHEMPFMAFQAENLENLAALTALLADVVEERFVDGAEAQGVEAQGAEAQAELDAAHAAAADSGIVARAPAPEDVPRSAVGLRRGRGVVATRTGTQRRRRFAQSA